mmetsp:Transcript_59574/g.132662  ORF Transcript_59574/g.132662 Transcript_59574/m.132662 type:complete len:245 (-) Transcript_59574:174-908(-)
MVGCGPSASSSCCVHASSCSAARCAASARRSASDRSGASLLRFAPGVQSGSFKSYSWSSTAASSASRVASAAAIPGRREASLHAAARASLIAALVRAFGDRLRRLLLLLLERVACGRSDVARVCLPGGSSGRPRALLMMCASSSSWSNLPCSSASNALISGRRDSQITLRTATRVTNTMSLRVARVAAPVRPVALLDASRGSPNRKRSVRSWTSASVSTVSSAASSGRGWSASELPVAHGIHAT